MERVDPKFLNLAEKRNRLIPKLIENNSVHLPPNPQKTQLMRWFVGLFIGDISILGENNLKEAIRLSQKNRVICTRNHQTDLDHTANRHIFEAQNFREFANKQVYPSGLKMIERWWVRPFMGAEHSIFIATPNDLDAVKLALAKDKQNPLLVGYEANLKDLNEAAMAHLDALSQQAFVIQLYPEATRSRHPAGLIQRPPKSVALYTRPAEGKEAYVLPWTVVGLNRILPPGKFIRFLKANLDVVFGEPYPISEIWDPRRAKVLKAMGAEKADYMMAKIAVLNPKLVDPHDLDFYQRVLAA